MLSSPSFGRTQNGTAYITGAFPHYCNPIVSEPTVLVFAHCNGFCKEVWLPVIEDLSRLMQETFSQKVPVEKQIAPKAAPMIRYVALDFLGHGQSAPLVMDEHLPTWRESLVPSLREVLQEKVYLTENERSNSDLKRPWNAIGVGHSLGGTGLLMHELKYPGIFQHLVLFEPVVIPPPRRKVFTEKKANSDLKKDSTVENLIAKGKTMTDKFNIFLFLKSFPHPLVHRTLQRRTSWKDEKEALIYFKKRFPNFDSRSLSAYVQGGMYYSSSNIGDERNVSSLDESYPLLSHHDENKSSNQNESLLYALRCNPVTEAAYYASVGDSIVPMLKQIKCPIILIAGPESDHFNGPWGDTVSHFRNISKLMGGECSLSLVKDGSHFCTMEHPRKCAALIFTVLARSRKCLL
mmetsp:Transcript_8991/g.11934  ORF Transcript_8991/g.11934 Transcript_8991/m.11934 type:complete len:406 (+) Transcript_8991:244-1461(+)